MTLDTQTIERLRKLGFTRALLYDELRNKEWTIVFNAGEGLYGLFKCRKLQFSDYSIDEIAKHYTNHKNDRISRVKDR